MNKTKVATIILGIVIIIMTIIMPFQLKQICYEHSIHSNEWSLGPWNAVQISATLYSIGISILTLIVVVLNIFKKSK